MAPWLPLGGRRRVPPAVEVDDLARMTDAGRGLEHRVRDSELILGCVTGSYRAVCGARIAPASLVAPIGVVCPACRVAGVRVSPGVRRVSPLLGGGEIGSAAPPPRRHAEIPGDP